MKKLAYYAGGMIFLIILLPLLIVRGCGHKAEVGQKENAPADKSYVITVYNKSTGKTTPMLLEEYIKGVVAAEMPASFDLEALKAQAVAARTFAYGRMSGTYTSAKGVHDGIDICTDPAHCQAWVSKAVAMKKWGIFQSARNWSKIVKAVKGTEGMIVVYQGTIANTVFHASSAGRTENAGDVWSGSSVPYLRSVESIGDEASGGFETSVLLEKSFVLEKLKKAFPDQKFSNKNLDKIGILGFTEGGRVKELSIGPVTMKGTEFRALLGLRSAAYQIKSEGQKLKITTEGYGHGVGMSQWGADALAKKGATYQEILKHYYTDVDVLSIAAYEELSGTD